MYITGGEVLDNLVSHLEQERENILLETQQTMLESDEAAKIAIAKLILIADILRMIETLGTSNY